MPARIQPRHAVLALALALVLTAASALVVDGGKQEDALAEAVSRPPRNPAPAAQDARVSWPETAAVPAVGGSLELPKRSGMGSGPSNPFQTKPRPVAAKKPAAAAAPPASVVAPLFAAVQSVPPVPETPVPSAPPLPFRYIGMLSEPDTGATVFFLARGDDVLTVRQGDTIDERYRLESSDSAHLNLVYLPLSIRQALAIGKADR
jgi:hypothetical protein